MPSIDNKFLKRADAHIALANEQLSNEVSQGDVSASFMYGTARFNAWIAACSFESADEMAREKEEIMNYFIKKYKEALEEHVNHHIEHFDFSANAN